MLLALAGELDGLHGRNLVIACGVLSVDDGVVMREVDLAMEEVRGGRESFGDVRVGRWRVLAVRSQPRLASFARSRSLSLSGASLGGRSVPDVPGLRGIGIVVVAMPSRSSPSKSHGSLATDAGAATLRAGRSVISRRRKASASMAGLASSSSSSPMAETLHVDGYPQD